VAVSAISSSFLQYKGRALCTFLCNKGGGREDITPRNTCDNTFIGRNVYTTAKQGAKATLVYLLSGPYQVGTQTSHNIDCALGPLCYIRECSI
jgi:hypothetical protein